MNIQAIKTIVNSDYPNEIKESLIIEVLSKDEKVIPKLLEILQLERTSKQELISEMNLQLSRIQTFVEHSEMELKKFGNADTEFILEEVDKFYKNYKDQVSHCFKNKN